MASHIGSWLSSYKCQYLHFQLQSSDCLRSSRRWPASSKWLLEIELTISGQWVEPISQHYRPTSTNPSVQPLCVCEKGKKKHNSVYWGQTRLFVGSKSSCFWREGLTGKKQFSKMSSSQSWTLYFTTIVDLDWERQAEVRRSASTIDLSPGKGK